MTKPNFFIIGAPKCGTTALYSYLKEHNNVFMPDIKEPHFFAEDYPNIRKFTTLAKYLQLFDDVQEQHLAIGEASVHYIHSEIAVQKIFEFDPDSKIIIMLRNPIELVRSLHAMSYSLFNENVEDFEQAWRLQEFRAQDKMLPPNYPEPKLLQYAWLGKLGSQVENVLSIFPLEQVKFILFDEFQTDTKSVYDSVLKFLNIASDSRDIFPRINVTGEHRFRRLGWFVEKTPRWAVTIKRSLMGETDIRPLARKILKRPTTRKPLTQTFRAELVDEFKDDIRLLSKLTQYDLNHWLG